MPRTCRCPATATRSAWSKARRRAATTPSSPSATAARCGFIWAATPARAWPRCRARSAASARALLERRNVRAEPRDAGVGRLAWLGRAAVGGAGAALVGLGALGDVGAAGADRLGAELLVGVLRDVAEAGGAI